MEKIKIQCPAKINLTLEIVNKRNDGFHNIKSIMQTISLYDYLTIQVQYAQESEIKLSGTSLEIPYNESNLVYKAAKLYLEKTNIENVKIEIFIEKNIPVSAGLAGGSTDAAGTLYGLNKIFKKLDINQLHQLCAELGSDLNVCLQGGCTLATSRGEITKPLNFVEHNVTLIKPKNLGISAGHAYKSYSEKDFKPKYNMTEKMAEALKTGKSIKEFLYNDLEYAVFDEFEELQKIKNIYPNAIMSGSGSTYFVLENLNSSKLDENYLFINNLNFIPKGISAINL